MMIFEIHAIQNFNTSALNRSDNGYLKSIFYGDSYRQRVSSQCWKRAMRESPSFKEYLEEDVHKTGVRTREIPSLVAETGDSKKTGEAAKLLEGLGFGKSEKDKATETYRLKTMVFLSHTELSYIKNLFIKHGSDGKSARKEFDKDIAHSKQLSLDIALFGRMMADNRDLDVHGSVSMTHALGVTASQNTKDFFTALDDISQVSGMLDTQSISSPTFYRYGSINLNILKNNLNSDLERMQLAVAGFIKSFAFATPTSKKNSTAPYKLPNILIVRKAKTPLTLDGAFEKQIVSDEANKLTHTDNAIKKMNEFIKALNDNFDEFNKDMLFTALENDVEVPFAKRKAFPELLSEVQEWL